MKLAVKKIGAYSIGEELGSGATSKIYKGYDATLDQTVAFKIFNDPSSQDESKSIAYEWQAAARLRHPNILQIFDYGTISKTDSIESDFVAGTPWIAMEYIQGTEAKNFAGILDWEILYTMFMETLAALAHAHAHNILHRDIKPNNILLCNDTYQVKLVDFGLAHNFRAENKHELEESIEGTPAYISPEQIQCAAHSFGPWTDLYSVGVMVWTMLHGYAPYSGSYQDIFDAHLHGRLPAFSPKMPVPDGIETWIQNMMATRIKNRFQHAADAAWALQQLDHKNLVSSDTSFDPHDDPLDDATIACTTDKLYLSNQTTHIAPSAVSVYSRPPIPDDWKHAQYQLNPSNSTSNRVFHFLQREFIGREAERNTLWKSVSSNIEQEQAHMVLVEGASGTGKSSLISWTCKRFEELGAATCIHVPFQEQSGTTSLERVLHDWLGLSYVPELESHAFIHNHWGIDDQDDCEMLATLLNSKSEFSHIRKENISDSEKLHCLARLFVHLSQKRPLMIWVEDLLANEKMYELATMIVQSYNNHPIIILSSVQKERIVLSSKQLERRNRCLEWDCTLRLSLYPLSRGEMQTFISNLLPLDIKLQNELEERAQGNPNFVIEILSDVIANQQLHRKAGIYHLNPGIQITLPQSIQDIWKMRVLQILGQYNTDTQYAIELAAVLGKEVTLLEWKQVCLRAGFEYPKKLMKELYRQQLIMQRNQFGDWSFVHAMLRESILEIASQRVTRWSSICADVLLLSPQNIHRSARLLIKAHRHQEAIEPLYTEIQRNLLHGEHTRALLLLERQEEIISTLNQSQYLDAIHASIAQKAYYFERTGDLEKARSIISPLMESLHTIRHEKNKARILTYAGLIYAAGGMIEEGESYLKEALSLATSIQDFGQMCMVVNLLGFTYLRLGKHDELLAISREGIYAGERIGNLDFIGTSYNNLARSAWQQGHYERALFYMDESDMRFQKTGNRTGITMNINIHGEIKRSMGRLDDAEKMYLKVLERFRKTNHGGISFAELNLLLIQLEKENIDVVLTKFPAIITTMRAQGRNAIWSGCKAIYLYPLSKKQRWEQIETELPQIIQDIKESKFIDIDVARFTAKAALECFDRQQKNLSLHLYRLSLSQWKQLGRQDKVLEIQQQLDVLAQDNHHT